MRSCRRRIAFVSGLIAAPAFLLLIAAAEATAQSATPPAKVIVIGFDGMDPDLLDGFRAAGRMPNFDRLIAGGDLQKLGTSIPPQSPVAWANFITGQDAGGHGIFDFIHRDPQTMIPNLSTSEATPPDKFIKIGKWKIPRGSGRVELKRHGTAFWEILADRGVDATVIKVPSNFPPVECEARSLSGMGTPDILGTYGVFTYYTDDPPANMDPGGGRVVVVDPSRGRFTTEIRGPRNTYREGDPEATLPLAVTVDPANPAVVLEIGKERLLLQEGEWSGWVTLRFEMVPVLKTVRGIARFHLMEVRPSLRLYLSPIQIDPEQPEMPISTPGVYSRDLAKAVGLYYTQGLPEDTKALEEGIFADHDYAGQADLIMDEQLAQYRYELTRFRDLRRGFLFFYFNSPDQSCHMFWRNMDRDSPAHADADPRYADRMGRIYETLDAALGEALAVCDDKTLLIVMSDHGFAPYHRSFHVNAWLLENGYLALQAGTKREDAGYLRGIDWSRTRAYAVGINGLYLNMRGRELRGIVGAGDERETLLRELVEKLEAVTDPESGALAIKHAYRADQVYHGALAGQGPDIVIGYARGFRGSNESALAQVPQTIFEDNHLKWSGDHCMAADEVPGIIACNRPLTKPDPELRDLAPTILRLFGIEPPTEIQGADLFAPPALATSRGDR